MAEVESHIPVCCTAFCEVCGHGVHNMETHIQTEDHKRNLRRQSGETTGHRPRIPTGVGIARITKEERL